MTQKQTTPEPTLIQKVVTFVYHWAAWIIISVLAAAGVIHLLSGVDEMLRYVFAVVIVGLILKELY